MKSKKKWSLLTMVLSLLAGIVMIGGISVVSQAESFEGTKEGDFWYIGGGEDPYSILSGYEGTATDIVIPDTLGGKPVKEIYENSFQGNTAITSVSFPASLNWIREYAFDGCSNLKTITFRVDEDSENASDKLKIDDYAFKDCGIENALLLPDNLNDLGTQSFAGCTKITEVTIEGTLGSYLLYGIEAFKGCTSLLSVEIKNGVDGVAKGMFSGCTSLNSVDLADTVINIGDNAFEGCSSLSNISYKDEQATSVAVSVGLISIGNAAFKDCTGLTDVKLPNGVLGIGDSAFENCKKITNIDWPTNLTSIGKYAFKKCTGINTVQLPDSVTLIAEEAFYGCSQLSTIYVPRKADCGNDILKDCSSSLVITTTKGETEFENSEIEKYANENNINIEYINAAAKDEVFEEAWQYRINENEETVTIVKYVGEYGSDEVITVPQIITKDDKEYTVTAIGDYAFILSTVGKIIVADTVKTIGQGAFSGAAVSKICIPKSVDEMGAAAFGDNKTTTVYTETAATGVIRYLEENDVKYVTVIDNITLPEEITVSTNDGSKELPITIEPSGATDRIAYNAWQTSNGDVAYVIQDTLADYNKADVVSYGVGKALVKVTYVNELTEKEITASCLVTVTDDNVDDNPSGEPGSDDPSKGDDSSSQPTTQQPTTGQPSTQKSTEKTTEKAGTVIKPVVNKVSKFKAANSKKKQLKLTWKKVSGAAGYELQYGTDKKYKKVKKVSISKSKTSYTLKKKLVSGKKYYLRIRAYKTYKNESGKTEKVYGKWVKVSKKVK